MTDTKMTDTNQREDAPACSLARPGGGGEAKPPARRLPALAQARLVCDAVARTARLMVGLPDYDAYVAHRECNHPGEPVMSYEDFFRDRQQARYAFEKGRFRGCC
jgi:uncharacterized short protein YbdD (DUF466 family)